MQIGSIGFPAVQRMKLEKIFKLSKQKSYSLVEPDFNNLPDLMLVSGFDINIYPELLTLPVDYSSRLILVGKGKPDDNRYTSLGFPLVSSRVLRVLDRMADELEVSRFSPVELGTTPVTQPENTSAQSKKSTSSKDRTCFHVLVVDDNETMQQALNTELQTLHLPVNVDFAGTGEEALNKIEQNQYDFIFLDVVMPGIDGFEACAEIRKHQGFKKTPIIMLTSKTSPLDEVKGIMSGCSTYLTKPIVHDEFQKVISRVSNWVDEFQKA